jgi:hypothetical protein
MESVSSVKEKQYKTEDKIFKIAENDQILTGWAYGHGMLYNGDC